LADCAQLCASRELAFLADSLAGLPTPSQADWSGLIAYDRNKETIRALLARLCREQPDLARQIDLAIEQLNGDPEKMDALLLRQNYRLLRWRTAARELVYRRFFDINTLVGLRVEDERVFEDTPP
jgi:(1->4)-alpha-D-glucan 1-alpha-D-glucosylmutase